MPHAVATFYARKYTRDAGEAVLTSVAVQCRAENWPLSLRCAQVGLALSPAVGAGSIFSGGRVAVRKGYPSISDLALNAIFCEIFCVLVSCSRRRCVSLPIRTAYFAALRRGFRAEEALALTGWGRRDCLLWRFSPAAVGGQPAV